VGAVSDTRAGAPQHVERLWPGPWVWVLALTGVAVLAVAYGSSLGGAAAAAVAGVGLVVALLAIVASATRIVVGPQGLRAGRAVLPWQFAGRVVALDEDGARTARGPQGDPTAFLLLRPGVGPGAVVVEVTDPEDPHRTWLLATRDPQRLARAIDRTRGTLSR
jgi:hypothetical protein